ncbi:MAG TPA: malectin domain-containing carbohydrate-binding protein [Vicinamibacterales bacterium]|nr:malectin domain-containing carbohydrate-binding protein [Vicinamibacterales bacterium]
MSFALAWSTAAVAQTQAVTSFTLINADTDQPIAAFNPIHTGATIDLAALPTLHLNIRANTSPSTVGSVRFRLDGNANFRTDNAAPYALSAETGGNYAAWTPSLGSHTVTATPYTKSNASGKAGTPLTITFFVTQLRINAGGPAYTDGTGSIWTADAAFSGGTKASTTAAIAGTSDPTLYQTERYGTFSYNIPVPNGKYTVTLLFAEIYWTSAGKRVFDVNVEGQLAIQALDIFAAVGANTALVRSVTTTVSDGVLNLNFISTVDNAKVSAIRVTAGWPANQPPVVSAGTDQSIMLPANSVTLTGTATDDGLPSPPAALTYGWSLVSGPGAVTFSAPTSLVTTATFATVGTYTLRLAVSDSALTTTADVHVSVNANTIVVSVSPVQAGVVVGQRLPLAASVQNDPANAGVTWSAAGTGCAGAACGSFADVTPLSATYVAPSAAGVYTVTATSAADGTIGAVSTVAVTDLAGVLTYHNNLSRDGTNSREFLLSPSLVATPTFGKLFSCAVDGAIYAQPLWVPRVTIAGSLHNVVVVATEHDSVYAFDADASPCVPLWQANLLDAAHGATPGETPVPSGIGGLVGAGYGDISPETGVTGTPVIDAATNRVYVIAKSATSTPTVYQRLHALDLATGNDVVAPRSIDASISVAGNGDGAVAGRVAFDPLHEHQRPGLALANGVVYVAWASHEDADPYHGWVIGFDAATLAPAPNAVFNSTPNSVGSVTYSRGGIWMGGGAPPIDANGNLFVMTGNGTFDANAGGSNYGDSFVKLTTTGGLAAADYFTPSNETTLDANDKDLGSGGAAILIDQTTGPVPHLLIGGGKDGNLFLLNRDAMGGFSSASNNVRQSISLGNAIFGTPVFWQNSLYIAGGKGALKQFVFNPSTGLFNASPASESVALFGFPGSTPSLSSAGSINGIVWALDNSAYCTNQSKACGPAVLHAYDATNLAVELWNSAQAAGQRDQAGRAVKFTVPTVANGKVYVGTRGNDTTVLGELEVYGLLIK